MKKKFLFSILSVIGFCLILACNGVFDTITESAARSLNTNDVNEQTTIEEFYAGLDEKELMFFRNQSISFSIIDEAMRPFIIGYTNKSDETDEEIPIYCESFAGVFIDNDGNLNIGVIQNAVTEQVEISMNLLKQ